jgi:hypothetical protein
MQALQRVQYDPFAEDRGEYLRYLQRSALRLKQLQPFVELPGQSATRAGAAKPAGAAAATSTATTAPAATSPAR